MRPKRLDGLVARALDIGKLVTSTANAIDLAAIAELARGLLGESLVAIPDRHAGAGIEKALDDGAPDALRAAGDDGELAGQIDLVGHGAFLTQSSS